MSTSEASQGEIIGFWIYAGRKHDKKDGSLDTNHMIAYYYADFYFTEI